MAKVTRWLLAGSLILSLLVCAFLSILCCSYAEQHHDGFLGVLSSACFLCSMGAAIGLAICWEPLCRVWTGKPDA